MEDDRPRWTWREFARYLARVDILFTVWYAVFSGFILIRTFLYSPVITLVLDNRRKCGGYNNNVNVTFTTGQANLELEADAFHTLTIYLIGILVGTVVLMLVAAAQVVTAVKFITFTSPGPGRTPPLDDLQLEILEMAWLRRWWWWAILATALFPLVSVPLSKNFINMLPMASVYAAFRGLWMISVWKFMGEWKAAAAAASDDETGTELSEVSESQVVQTDLYNQSISLHFF